MKMRPPSVPLITIDPYFSVWSPCDKLYEKNTEHWTGSPNSIIGIVNVDGKDYRFMGTSDEDVIEQKGFNMTALTSEYVFENEQIKLFVKFYTPLILSKLELLSRPVSYVSFDYQSVDNQSHNVKVSISVSEEICLNKKNEGNVIIDDISYDGLNMKRMGNSEQKILNRSGDDVRIDWGYFYFATSAEGSVKEKKYDDMTWLEASVLLDSKKTEYILFAYDDVMSINYFGDNLSGYWHKNYSKIEEAISCAFSQANHIYEMCLDFSASLYNEAFDKGGEKYAELLVLAYRQSIAAHKLVLDKDDNVLFISKECFSNGCAATVDVTYPSSPLFLKYNSELLKGMLRPIFKYAKSSDWEFDFAPHDVGQYPLLLGQVYGAEFKEEGRYREFQMPIEECGNMLIMMTNICLVDGNTEFYDLYKDLLIEWVKYLEQYGMDPENQLCTDDFAGHLAHNCNLSLKAIMGLAGYSIILKMKNDANSEIYFEKAKSMAENWLKQAANKDGSFKLTFNMENTFSMKYNMIWDKLWKTELFPPYCYNSEFSSYRKHINAYGLPLDSRKTYTKSDWLVWCGILAPTKMEFEEFIAPLWNAYNVTHSRVPMSDWYDTVSANWVSFKHRSVQGGLFIKLLDFIL